MDPHHLSPERGFDVVEQRIVFDGTFKRAGLTNGCNARIDGGFAIDDFVATGHERFVAGESAWQFAFAERASEEPFTQGDTEKLGQSEITALHAEPHRLVQVFADLGEVPSATADVAGVSEAFDFFDDLFAGTQIEFASFHVDCCFGGLSLLALVR